jgi:hypothetical protein
MADGCSVAVVPPSRARRPGGASTSPLLAARGLLISSTEGALDSVPALASARAEVAAAARPPTTPRISEGFVDLSAEVAGEAAATTTRTTPLPRWGAAPPPHMRQRQRQRQQRRQPRPPPSASLALASSRHTPRQVQQQVLGGMHSVIGGVPAPNTVVVLDVSSKVTAHHAPRRRRRVGEGGGLGEHAAAMRSGWQALRRGGACASSDEPPTRLSSRQRTGAGNRARLRDSPRLQASMAHTQAQIGFVVGLA